MRVSKNAKLTQADFSIKVSKAHAPMTCIFRNERTMNISLQTGKSNDIQCFELSITVIFMLENENRFWLTRASENQDRFHENDGRVLFTGPSESTTVVFSSVVY